VTDRPVPTNEDENLNANEEPSTINISVNELDENRREISKNTNIVSPEIRSFSKTGARQSTRKARKKRQTILTDSPVKEALQKEKENIQKKKYSRNKKIEKRIPKNKVKVQKVLFREKILYHPRHPKKILRPQSQR